MRRPILILTLTALVVTAPVLLVKNIGYTAGTTFAGTDESERYVGSDEADTLNGGADDDFLRGGGGSDTLKGDADDDTLVGDEPTDIGDDTIYGGEGVDEIVGGTGNDTEYGGPGNDLLGSMDYRDRDGPLIEDTGNDDIFGEDGDDFIYAGPGEDKLSGGSGVDNLFGSDDDDALVGESEADVLNGGSGVDLANYEGSPKAIVADLEAGTVIGDGEDVLISIERISGSGFGDTLSGSSSSDHLIGQAGNDQISGGTGQDEIEGGSGADTIRDRDQNTDNIQCGTGYDKVEADPQDLVAPDCELVDMPGSPTTTISSGPSGYINSASATFTFTSNDANATFQCSLDRGPFKICTSPATFSGLSDGSHVLRVRGVDGFRNFGTAVIRSWKVDTTSPTGSVTINNGDDSTASTQINLSMSATDNEGGSGIYQVCVSNSTTCTVWRAFTPERTWTLNTRTGTKTVYVRFKDRAGNVSDQVTDTITYTP